MIYIPGTYSQPDEVIALRKMAGKHGGVYASHMRDEGAKVLEAIENRWHAWRSIARKFRSD